MSRGTRGGSACCHHSRLTKQNQPQWETRNETKERKCLCLCCITPPKEAVQSDVSFESQPEAARRSVRLQAGKDDHKLHA